MVRRRERWAGRGVVVNLVFFRDTVAGGVGGLTKTEVGCQCKKRMG